MYEKVEDRDMHMRSIPEKEQKWAEKQFQTQGYIYYTKFGSLVRCVCGACGTEYMAFWKESEDPFEAMLQNVIKPAHNKPGKCKKCGYETKYKAAGKIRPDYLNAKGRYAIGQRMGKEEFVFRIFDVEQWMHVSGQTTYSHMEYIRIFCRPGKKVQKDYFVHDPWRGLDTWIDHNIGGMRNIPQPDDAFLTPGTWKAIRQTPMFKYVPDPSNPEVKEKYLNGNEYPVIRYYEAASKYLDFEMIVKNGMWMLTNSLIWKLGSGYRMDRKTYWDRLGIYKHRVKDLIEAYGSGELLRIFQLERLSEKKWDDKDNQDAKLPLIVTFHGSDEKGRATKYGRLFLNKEFQSRAGKNGAAVLSIMSRANYFTDPSSTRLLIQNICLQNECIDRTNIVAYGFSQGAAFVVEMACHDPRLFRGVVSGSGFYQMKTSELLTVLPIQFYFATSKNDSGIYEQGSETGKTCAKHCKNSRYVEYETRGHFFVELKDKTGRKNKDGSEETFLDWISGVVNP